MHDPAPYAAAMRILLPLLAVSFVVAGCKGDELYRLQHASPIGGDSPTSTAKVPPRPDALPVMEIRRTGLDGYDKVSASSLPPICDLRGATPKTTPKLADVQKAMASWNVGNEVRKKARAPKDQPPPSSNASPVRVDIKTSIDFGFRYIDTVELACEVGKPILRLNGADYPGSVLYGEVGEDTNLHMGLVVLELRDPAGPLTGLRLRWPTKTVPKADDVHNWSDSQVGFANIAPLLPPGAGEPIVHVVPTRMPSDKYDHYKLRLENLYVVPGSSPVTGVNVIVPNTEVDDSDRSIEANRFVVK